MNYEEKTVRKNYVYQGKILSLRNDDALLPDGRACKREIIEHSGGACALYVENGKALFVKQYRYAYGETVYEIPAGKLNAGEDPKKAALRELAEETGEDAARAKLLFVVYPTPGYTNEKIYVYQAFDGVQLPPKPDDGEFVEVEWIPIEEGLGMLKRGEIKDAKTIIALQAYFLNA